MALTTHTELHAEWMLDPVYCEAYNSSVFEDYLIELLAQWRRSQSLSSLDVAMRMGISPSSLADMEQAPSQATLDWFYRYAKACNITNPTIHFY